MSEGLKEFFLHKVTLRVIYILAAYSATHLVDLVSSQKIQSFLGNIFVDPNLKPEAVEFLRGTVGAGIMISGEFVYYFLHRKFILPHVDGSKIQGVQS